MHVAGEEKSERERLVCVLEQPENTVRRQWDVARREAAKETKNKNQQHLLKQRTRKAAVLWTLYRRSNEAKEGRLMSVESRVSSWC